MPNNGYQKAFAAWIASHPEPHADRPDEVFAAGFEHSLKGIRAAARFYHNQATTEHNEYGRSIAQSASLMLYELADRIQEGTWPTT